MLFFVLILAIWGTAAWAIWIWAAAWGYRPLAYILCSICLSPALPAFVLLFKGPAPAIVEHTGILEGRCKYCTLCGEVIRSSAKVCRFCNSSQPASPG